MFLRKQGVEKIPFAPFLSLGTLFSFFLNRGFLL
jgi:prepilin signal peptidase PulO-like enzyme (type II secretory pathway)